VQVTGELMAIKEQANDAMLEWQDRSEKAIKELDNAKGAHEETLRGVEMEAATHIQALERQLAEASNETRDAKKQVEEVNRIVVQWEERCERFQADFVCMKEVQVVDREEAARIQVMEQQLVEMTRTTNVMKAQHDEALAATNQWKKQEEALKKESSHKINQAVERLSTQHQQAMQALREECEASVQNRLTKQKDDEQVRHLLTGVLARLHLLHRKIGALRMKPGSIRLLLIDAGNLK
jgi:chemotaxis protein histidine kinase CheA